MYYTHTLNLNVSILGLLKYKRYLYKSKGIFHYILYLFLLLIKILNLRTEMVKNVISYKVNLMKDRRIHYVQRKNIFNF